MSEEYSSQLIPLLETMFVQWGADSAQAPVMARQLYRRSRQMAVEKGIPEAQALDYLVRLTRAAREGKPLPEAPETFQNKD